MGVVRSTTSVGQKGSGSDRCQIYGRTTLALGVSDVSGWWGRAVQFLVISLLEYPFIA